MLWGKWRLWNNMYPYIYIVLPSYGVLAFVGGFFALIFIYLNLEKYEIEFTDFLKLFIVAVVGGFFGSKLLFAITQISWLIRNYSWINLLILVPRSGYVYYGGLFGVLFFLWLVLKKDSVKCKRVFELIVPAIPLFHGFGRIGCMLAGCCYGLEMRSHWDVGFLQFDRIPVQLIESSYEFILFVFFVLLERRKSILYSLENYLIVYAIFRFFIEFFRGDEIRGIWVGGLSTAQYISVIIVATVITRKIIKKKKYGAHITPGMKL